MHNKLSSGSLGASRNLDVRLPRTCALLLGCLLATMGCLRVEVEAGEGGELEASMHSSLFREFKDVTDGIWAIDSTKIQQNMASPGTFPDTSAVVGRIFQMKVPNEMDDVYLGDIVKVSPNFLFQSVFSTKHCLS